MMKKVSPIIKWGGYRHALNSVATEGYPFLLAYGTGGIGRSYEVERMIEERGLRVFDHEEGKMVAGSDDYDVVILSGTSIKAMVKSLYEHRNKLIVFDDSDSIVNNKEFVNIAKAAFAPSKEDRYVTYSSVKLKTDSGKLIPSTFKFSGRVICITKLSTNTVPQALFDGCIPCDLTMDIRDTMKKLQGIYPSMKLTDTDGVPIVVEPEYRNMAYRFIFSRQAYLNVGAITARTMASLALTFKEVGMMSDEQRKSYYGKDWKEGLDEYLFTQLTAAG